MGEEAKPITVQQYMGLIIAGIAMWVYNLKQEVDKEGNSVEGASGKDTGRLDDPATSLPTATTVNSTITRGSMPQIQQMKMRTMPKRCTSRQFSNSLSIGMDRASAGMDQVHSFAMIADDAEAGRVPHKTNNNAQSSSAPETPASLIDNTLC